MFGVKCFMLAFVCCEFVCDVCCPLRVMWCALCVVALFVVC